MGSASNPGASGSNALWRLLGVVLVFVVAGLVGDAPRDRALPSSAPATGWPEEDEGRDESEPVSHKPTVEAAFAAESYRQGAVAKLVLFDSASRVSMRLYRVGDASGRLFAHDVMRGVPVGRASSLGAVARGQTIRVLIGYWRTGLYYAVLTARGGRLGYAPFVVAPAWLGQHRIAVVLPTQTWQAYNFRDDDSDGSPDTWYQGPPHTTARLHRPFENRGVPPHYRYYDEPFLRWLARNHYGVDFISDAELKTYTGDELARAYDVLIFPGHHEYVTTHEYDAVTRYRDEGGSLLFLSANNFYARITIKRGVMTRVGWWRLMGRPEASLVGVELFHSDLGEHRGPWIVRASSAGRWIFRGTGLARGDKLSSGGIEADNVAAASPRNVQVLAEIVNLYGDGRNAQMTYYRTRSGGQVFAAGAFSLAGSIWQPSVSRLVANLIAASLEA